MMWYEARGTMRMIQTSDRREEPRQSIVELFDFIDKTSFDLDTTIVMHERRLSVSSVSIETGNSNMNEMKNTHLTESTPSVGFL